MFTTPYNYVHQKPFRTIVNDDDVKVFDINTDIDPKTAISDTTNKGVFTNSSKPSRIFADITTTPFSPLEAQRFMNSDSSTAAPASDIVNDKN